MDDSTLDLIEWTATAIAIIGATFNVRKQYGLSYRIYIASNVAWALFGIALQRWGFVITQVMFLAINIYGIVSHKEDIATASPATVQEEG